jgi:hypothetical protein
MQPREKKSMKLSEEIKEDLEGYYNKSSYPYILSILENFINNQTDEIKEYIYNDLITTYYKKYNNLISKKTYKKR